jgi:RNA polymerase sigma-70 factor, ECF subfamily
VTPGPGAPLDRERLPDHLERLQRAAQRICRSRHDADDLVQETYVRVLARQRHLREDDPVGYLLRTLRNVYLSQRARRQDAALVDAEHERRAATPQFVAEVRELLDAVRALPLSQRSVLTAVDVAGLSYRETADLLGVPCGTVMSRLHRGRETVARRFRD